MRLLFLIDNLGSGGAQRQVVTLAPLFMERGHDISVLVYADADFFEPQLRASGVRVIKCLASNYFSRVWSIRKEIHRGGYDVVISFLDVPNFINNISSISHHRRWKVITSERSDKEEFMRSKRGRLFGWFQRFSDALVCNSANASRMWLQSYPGYEPKIHVIYNAVEKPHSNAVYVPRRDGKTHIVVAASYQYLKNPIAVVRAVSQMDTRDRERLQVDWYGNKYVSNLERDDAYREAQRLVTEFGLAETIRLHEATHRIHDRMKEADFVGLFSRVEGLPNTICESMMLGKPIIMTRVSDYSVLIGEENGFLCDWNDENSIRSAIEKAVRVPTTHLNQMGDNSHERAKRLFDPDRIVDEWEEIMRLTR